MKPKSAVLAAWRVRNGPSLLEFGLEAAEEAFHGGVLPYSSGEDRGGEDLTAVTDAQCKQHFLNFLPLPHGQGSFRPTFLNGLIKGWGAAEGARPIPPAARRS